MGAFSAIGSIVKQSASAKANIPTPPTVVVATKQAPVKGPEIATLTVATVGVFDSFLTKYYKTGELQWAVTVSGAGNETVTGVAADADGNSFVAATYDGDIVIKDTTQTTYSLGRATAVQHSLVAMYNPVGVLQWRAKLEQVWIRDIAVDSKSNVYLVVWVSGDPSKIYDKSGSSPFASVYGYSIVKYGADGTLGWIWKMPEPYNDYFFPLTVDKNDDVIYTTRIMYNGSVTANDRGLATGITLTSSTIFTMKLKTATGKVDWMAGIGAGSGYTSLRAVATDVDGNIFVGFHDRGSTIEIRNVGVSTGSLFTISDTNANYEDAYVVKYNTSGVAQWIVRIKQTSGSAILQNEAFTYRSIDCDSSGNVYVAGTFVSSVIEFINGNGSTSSTTLTNRAGNARDIFLAKFNSAGTLQWASRVGSLYEDNDVSVRVDRTTDEAYLAGYIDGEATVTDGLGGSSIISTAKGNYFILKFKSNGAIAWKTVNASPYAAQRIATDAYGNLFYGSRFTGGGITLNTKL